MKHRATKRPRRLLTAPPVRPRTGKQQQADFTAEGAPPPGKVALEPPSLPAPPEADRLPAAGQALKDD